MATDTLKGKPGAQGGATAGLRRLLLDNGALTALIVLVIAMSALSGDFLTADNLLNVGVHDATAGGSKDEYVKRSAKFGIRAEQKHLVIPRQQVARITKLAEIDP